MSIRKTVEVFIKNLRLRTIIGINDWERHQLQDIIISIKYKYDAYKAIESDNVEEAVDYKSITKKIIQEVEASEFSLLESLCSFIYKIVGSYPNVKEIDVTVEKPYALRFSDTVSVRVYDDDGHHHHE